MVNFSVCCIYWRRLQDWCKNWTGFIWRTRPCGTEGFKTSQSSVSLWTSSSCGFFQWPILLWGQHKLQLYNGSFTFREDCSVFKTSLWSRLCWLRHLSLHSGLQLLRFLQLPSCQSLSLFLLPRIWNVCFLRPRTQLGQLGLAELFAPTGCHLTWLSGCLIKMPQAKYVESSLLNCRPSVKTGWIFRSVWFVYIGIKNFGG